MFSLISRQAHSFWRNTGEMERTFPEKYVRKFGYTPQGCPLFWKFCKFAICYSALVVLAAITASWTSRARMTETRIRKWKYFRMEVLKGAQSRLNGLKSLAKLFKIRCLQSVSIFSILNHPCSIMVYYYLFDVCLCL